MNRVIQLEMAEKALRLDKETILMLVEAFLSTKEEYLQPMQKAIEEGDLPGIKSSVHRLKGAANNLRLEIIGKLALEIEEGAKTFDKDFFLKKLGEIEESFQKGAAELKELQGGGAD